MIFNMVDSIVGDDTGSGPITVTFLYYSTKDGLYKTLEKHCTSGGTVTAPTDVGNIASTEGSASVLFPDQTPALTFQGWTTTALTGLTYDLVVGALYIPTDGKTHFSLRLNAVTGLNPSIYITTTDAGTATIEWGDGNSNTDSTVGSVTFSHTYASAGDYWIKLSRDTGNYAPGQNTSTSVFVGGTVLNIKKSLIKCCFGGGIVTIGNYALSGCNSLKYITIPTSITSIGNNVFDGCHSLNLLILSNSITNIGNLVFNTCNSLKYITIPTSITSIGNNVFDGCHSLNLLILSNSITNIGNYGMYSCSSLNFIFLPSSITTINTSAFGSCFSAYEYIFESVTPPTLAAADIFSSISASTRIYVPDASVSAYKNATNWVTYKNYIYGISTRA